MSLLRRLFIVGVTLSVSTTAVAQTTYYVATTGDDSANTGLGWDSPYATISNAYAEADDDDTILVSNGEYVVSERLRVRKPVTIRGFNGRDVTIVNGDRTTQAFSVEHTGAVIADLTVSNCLRSSNYGGGIYIENGMVRDCLIVRNEAAKGGGIAMEASPVYSVVSNCIIRNNWVDGPTWTGAGGVYVEGGALVDCLIEGNTNFYANPGGGVIVEDTATEPITRCTIVSNHSVDHGGGVYVRGPATFIDCHIDMNTAAGSSSHGNGAGIYAIAPVTMVGGSLSSNIAHGYFGGGGLFQDLAMTNVSVIGNELTLGGWGGVGIYIAEGNYNVVIDRCDISFNDSPGCRYYGGGGICHRGTNMIVRNCRIVGNGIGTDAAETDGRGGGVHIERAGQASLIENCTIAGNFARNRGGGFSMEGDGDDVVRNCVVYENEDGGGVENWWFGNAARGDHVHYTCTPDAMTGTDNITDAPNFVDSANDNYRLAHGSPCIDAGQNQSWMNGEVDMDGNPRLAFPSAQVDMGCYEYRFSGTAIMIQ